MIHGFDTDKQPVPDYILMRMELRDWRMEMGECKSHPSYLRWKVDTLNDVLKDMLKNEWKDRDSDCSARINYRVKARDITLRSLEMCIGDEK